MTSPIQVHGADDAGGRDDVSATVAGAVDAAVARYTELQGDTFGSGSTIGDVMQLPPVPANVVPPADSPLYPYQGDEPVG